MPAGISEVTGQYENSQDKIRSCDKRRFEPLGLGRSIPHRRGGEWISCFLFRVWNVKLEQASVVLADGYARSGSEMVQGSVRCPFVAPTISS